MRQYVSLFNNTEVEEAVSSHLLHECAHVLLLDTSDNRRTRAYFDLQVHRISKCLFETLDQAVLPQTGPQRFNVDVEIVLLLVKCFDLGEQLIEVVNFVVLLDHFQSGCKCDDVYLLALGLIHIVDE